MRSQRFPRSRRLKRQRLIRPLFEKGRRDVVRVRRGVLLVFARWAPCDEVGRQVPFQMGFTPGRRRTHVLRVRIRRLLRESFRKHQTILYDALDSEGDIVLTAMILFRGREETASEDIRRDMPALLERLSEKMRLKRAETSST